MAVLVLGGSAAVDGIFLHNVGLIAAVAEEALNASSDPSPSLRGSGAHRDR